MRIGRVVEKLKEKMKKLLRIEIKRIKLVIGKGKWGRKELKMRKILKIIKKIEDKKREVEFGIEEEIVIIEGIERRKNGIVKKIIRKKEKEMENGERVKVLRNVRKERERIKNENVGKRWGKKWGNCREEDKR